MTKEVRVLALCDGEHDERTLATHERTIQIDGFVGVLDLCDAHDKAFLDPLIAMVERAPEPEPKKRTDQPARSTTTPVDYRTCRICGFVSKSRNGLGTHVRKDHDLGLREMDAQADAEAAGVTQPGSVD